ncbi:NAD-dependent epimerase/dehydratase family protein [Chloroflexota bacterium]
MTYCVTGGTGFIGSRIVRNLVREGEQVVVYDWFPERIVLERLLSEEEIQNQVKIVQGDVTNFSQLIRTLKDNNIEKIIHMAAIMLLEINANPLQGVKVNCEGTVAIFEAARFLGLKKVVWASTGSVFGPEDRYSQEYIPDDAPQYPQNIYGAIKSLDEFVAGYYSDRYDMDITAIRYVMVYGAWQKRGRTAAIIRQLVCNPALGKPGKVPAAADNVLGWTYVEDAARAMVMAIKADRTKTKAYSVMGAIHTVQEIADCVREFLPDADITLLPLDRSASHTIMTCKYDTRLIEEELGFRSRWTMKQGMKETINLVRQEHGLNPV